MSTSSVGDGVASVMEVESSKTLANEGAEPLVLPNVNAIASMCHTPAKPAWPPHRTLYITPKGSDSGDDLHSPETATGVSYYCLHASIHLYSS